MCIQNLLTQSHSVAVMTTTLRLSHHFRELSETRNFSVSYLVACLPPPPKVWPQRIEQIEHDIIELQTKIHEAEEEAKGGKVSKHKSHEL